MKKKMRFARFALLAGAAILAVLVFFPRTYPVPAFQKRSGTQYWAMTGGSRIGYTHIPAKGQKKPFPVIFLQGGPGAPVYDRNIGTLGALSEEGYDVYLYDQIGCGHSDRLEHIQDYTAGRHKKDLEEIVRLIGAEKVILIGQSWGAMLATFFVAGNADKVAKVILVSPGPVMPRRAELAAVKPPDSLHLREPVFSNASANQSSQNLRTKAMAFWATTFGLKLASDREADDYQTCLTGALNKATVCDTARAPKAEAGGGYYAHVMTVRSLSGVEDPRPKLRAANMPVLVMKGQCDNQKWGFTNEYLTLFPNASFVLVPDAGHSISIERPEVYLRAIRAFLNR